MPAALRFAADEGAERSDFQERTVTKLGILYDLASYAREAGRKGALRQLTPEQLLRLSAARRLCITETGAEKTKSPGKRTEKNKRSA
jgi:hypothetical protein